MCSFQTIYHLYENYEGWFLLLTYQPCCCIYLITECNFSAPSTAAKMLLLVLGSQPSV